MNKTLRVKHHIVKVSLAIIVIEFVFLLRVACGCPKGDPHWVPPILSQQCKENGACYCPSYNGNTYTMTEKGCQEASKKRFIWHLLVELYLTL